MAVEPKKTMSLRLDPDQASALEMIARADESTVSDTVRVAIDQLIAERRKDAAFQTRLAAIVQRERDVLARLAE
ncbi:MAG: hypothetical protein V9E83_07930 [Baekduia sp.]